MNYANHRVMCLRTGVSKGLSKKSRMMGDYHVRFCEGLRGKFLRATRRFVLK